MNGFRKINGINWLTEEFGVRRIVMKTGQIKIIPKGKLPMHWRTVRNILLTNKSA